MDGNKTTFQDAAASKIIFDIQFLAAQNLELFQPTKMPSF